MSEIADPVRDRRSGIVTFAAALFLLVGAFNIADGMIAMFDSTWFEDADLLFADLGAWGATMFIMGVVQLGVGWAVLRRYRAGQIFGMVIAGLNAFAHLLFIRHFPVWSVIIMTMDVLIIYVLAVHDTEFYD